jgi:hypothetical protein
LRLIDLATKTNAPTTAAVITLRNFTIGQPASSTFT